MRTQDPILCYTLDDVVAMLQLEKEDIRELIPSKVILAMKLADGELCFPMFQFPELDFSGDLISVFQQFPAHWDGWEVTSWFHREHELLGDLPVNLPRTAENLSRMKLIIDLETGLALLP